MSDCFLSKSFQNEMSPSLYGRHLASGSEIDVNADGILCQTSLTKSGIHFVSSL